jgi:hypothetical protein
MTFTLGGWPPNVNEKRTNFKPLDFGGQQRISQRLGVGLQRAVLKAARNKRGSLLHRTASLPPFKEQHTQIVTLKFGTLSEAVDWRQREVRR